MAITPKAPGQISAPNTLTGEAVGNVAVPNTLTGEAVGVVAAPNTLTGEAVGVVAAPNTLTGEAVGTVSAPNTLTSEAVGSVSAPNTLVGEAVGSVSAPNTLTANAAGSVSAPNTLTGEAVGSVSAPNTLVGATPAAFPRTLTPLVDMNFATQSYAQSGTPVAFDDLFTYSRASSATFTNRRAKATGGYDYFLDTDYVGDVTNLVRHSEQFDNATWFKTNVAVTTNSIIAPDGTTTAEKVTKTGFTGNDRVSEKILGLPVATYTFNCYVKNFDTPSGGKTNLTFRNNSVSGSIIARAEFVWSGNIISSGSINSGVGEFSFRDAGGGWWLISLTGLFSATDLGINIDINRGTGSTIENSIYIWGAQLTESAKVLPYVKTLDAPVTQTFSETLRTEYDAATGEALGALIEGGSTNLALYSEDFSNAAWGKSDTTITSNVTTAPDGTLSADKFTDSVDVSEHFMEQSNINQNNNTFTASLYIKRSNTDDFYFGLVHVGQSPTTSFADYNFVSDTFTGLNGLITSGTSKKLDNGWVRISITYTLDAFVTSHRIRLKTIPGVVAGTGTSCYIWGAQVEALPSASSYIRTEGAAVSRSGDNLSISPYVAINPNETSFNVVFDSKKTATGLQMVFRHNGVIEDYRLYIDSSYGLTYGNVATANGVFVPNETFNISGTFDGTISKLYKDNELLAQAPNTTPIQINSGLPLYLGTYDSANNHGICGHISKFATYDKALTAQEITLL